MSTDAITGVGAVLYRWDSEPSEPVFAAMAEINSITFDGFSRETIDVTDLKTASVNNGYRSKIAGLRDSGTFSFNLNFTHTQYSEMKEDFESNENQIYAVVLPDDELTYLEFEGLITDLPLDIPLEDRINSDISVAIDGKVDVGEGAGSSGSSLPIPNN